MPFRQTSISRVDTSGRFVEVEVLKDLLDIASRRFNGILSDVVTDVGAGEKPIKNRLCAIANKKLPVPQAMKCTFQAADLIHL